MRKAFECVLCEGIYADAPVSECDCASKANVFSEGVILSGDEWESLRKDARLLDILVEALAEVKATSDGHGDQPIADIVSGCLAEIEAISSPENPS